MKHTLLALFSLPLLAFASTDKKEDLKKNVNFIGSVFEAQYAPMKWKQSFANFDLNVEVQKVLQEIDTRENLTQKEFQRLLRGLIYSTKDYHVGIRFLSTEAASLPFQVKGAGDKYFISFIDRKKLSSEAFPFEVGDELISFGGKPAAEAVAELLPEVGYNVPVTDKSLAEMKLTSRTGSTGMHVPKGAITIEVKKKDTGKIENRQLSWEYKAEKIGSQFSGSFEDKDWHFYNMSFAEADLFSATGPMASANAENPHLLGAKRSFIPRLGTVVWESSDSDLFDAYVYKTAEKDLVGVIRIPGYITPGSKYAEHIAEFSKVINQMEKTTDALVIDQVNNPGGSVFYLYALASILSDKPLQAPLHEMKITQQDVLEAQESLPKLEKITNDDEARALYGKDIHGYPVNFQLTNFELDFANFIISEWNAGKSLTAPFYIGGVDKINPYPAGQYTKPIMIVTNELDFSGGDFFPAIMQDNKRATIFGTRTAGAGGYVLEQKFTNRYGIARFTVTGSLAERVNNEPIENLGVTPDIPYSLTQKDLQENYVDYVKAINESVKGIINNK